MKKITNATPSNIGMIINNLLKKYLYTISSPYGNSLF